MKHNARVVTTLIGVGAKSLRRLALWVLIFIFAASPMLSGIAHAAPDTPQPLSRGESGVPSRGGAEGWVHAAVDTPAGTPAADVPASPSANPPTDPGQGNKPSDPGKPNDPTLPPGDGGQVETLSAGVGSDPTEFSFLRDPARASLNINTDAATGAFTYSFPLTIPPGRNGMQPSLSLNYHSQDLKNDSLVGYGWSLPVPSIERIPRKGVDKLYTGTDEFFTSSLSGELELIPDPAGGQSLQSGTGSAPSSAQMVSRARTLPQPVELPEKRTRSSATFLKGYDETGREIYATKLYSGELHYRDPITGAFEPIDTALEQTPGGWRMAKAAYGANLNAEASGTFVTFVNQGQELSLALSLPPQAFVPGAAQTPVRGIPTTAPGKRWANREVVYPDALKPGISIALRLNNEALTKDVVIESLEALGDLTGKEYYEVSFHLAANRPVSLMAGGASLDAAGTIITSGMAEITDDQGVVSYLWPPSAEDAKGSPRSRIPIEISYQRASDGGIDLVKRIPVSWLAQASFPVTADVTVSYYAGSGDGYVHQEGTSWSAIRNAAQGTAAFYANTTALALSSWYPPSSIFTLDRAFLPINTAGVPVNLITAASFHLYFPTITPSNAAALTFVQTSQASPAQLTIDDYDAVGLTALTTPVPYGQLAAGAYNIFQLPSSAWGLINGNGYTFLGPREATYDLANIAPPQDPFNGWFYFSTSEAPGTSQDPYLEITHYDNLSTPSWLEAEGKANPVDVKDSTPEFTALYNDPSGTNALSYQIQVSSTPGNWASPVWDSGKTALGASLPQGTRSVPVSYAGSPLAADGTIYYWRIRFWNSSDQAGAWSEEDAYFRFAMYGARVENGEFLRYAFVDNTWAVTDKRGTVYTFGPASSSRQDNATGAKIYKWMIQKIQDTNGNFVRFEYFKDTGQIYPSKIFYTGNAADPGIFEIEFLRQARADKAVQYHPGFPVTTNYRISEIQAKVSGIWKRTYVLGYAPGDNGIRSLLATITETGWDDATPSVPVTLPATTFNYSAATKGWGPMDTTSYVIPDFFSVGGKDNSVRLFEINGDGYVDIAGGNNSTVTYLNKTNGTGWQGGLYGSLPEPFTYSNPDPGYDLGTRAADVNGDGLADIVRGFQTGDVRIVYFNDRPSQSWLWQPSFYLPEYFAGNNGSQGLVMSEVNGDGLLDLIRSDGLNGVDTRRLYLNQGDGTGWAQNTNYSIPVNYLDTEVTQDTGTRMADVNGDDLDDFVVSKKSGTNIYQNTYLNKGDGTGWVLAPGFLFPANIFFRVDTSPQGTALVDVNGDGLVDILHSHSDGITETKKAFINKGDGTGWLEDTGWGIPDRLGQGSISWDIGVRLADINADGLVDFIRSEQTNGNPPVTNKWTFTHLGNIPDLLTSVTQSTGASSAVTYQASTQYKNGSTLLNPSLPFPVQAVKQIVTNDGRGTQSTSTYSYEGGSFYFNTPYDRKFAGFQKVVETDNSGNVTKTFYHQGNSTDSANGEFSDHISKRGKPYRVEQYNNTSNLFSKTINKWEHVLLGGNRYFVKTTQEITFSYDGDTDHRDTAVTYTYDDTNGNLTQKKEWGEVTGSDNGTFTDIGTDSFTTDITYASNIPAYLIGLPKQETTTDQSAVKIAETRHYYDLQSLGSVTKGNETKTEHWVTGTPPAGGYIDIEKTYNTTYGLVTQEKDPRDKATNYTYDSFNLFPATVQNPLLQQTQYLYDYSSGKVTQVTDPNTRVFQTVYDGLDRVKEEKQPDKTTPTTLVTKATYSYNDSANPRSVTKVNYLDATLTNDSVTYVDGLDRTIQTRTRAEDANTYSVKDVVYDTLGHVQKESLPYFGTGSAFTTATTNNALNTSYTYDALDRVVASVNAVGSTSHAYDQWKETVTDAKGKVKDYTSDAYGNLVKVEEHNGAAVYTTTYVYNGLSKLTNITDALGNVRNFTYDGLGRRLTAQDLHAPADGTFGTWTYAYDAASNLVTHVDPKNQTVNYTYDDLNRVLTEDYTGQTGTEKSYAYDTCTEGIGRLCSVNADADTAYTYYATGEDKTEQKTIDSSSYTTTYTYDRQGNAVNIKYPDNSEVQYAYNAGGLIETVQKKESGGAFVNVVIDFDYSPLGQVTYQANANNTATTNTYDQNELWRLKRKLTTGPGGEGGGGTPTTVTFYAGTGDGAVYNRSSSWSTTHDAATGYSASYTGTTNYVRTGKYSSLYYLIERSFLPFDTSSLPDNVTVTDAKLKVYVYTKSNADNDGDDWVSVVQTTQPSVTSLTTADYDLAGAITNPIEGIDVTERKDITSVATSQYLIFNLNATGKSWVNKTGYTKLGLREGHDALNSQYAGANYTYNEIRWRTANYTGTSFDPILEITYTTAPPIPPPYPTVIQDISYTYDAVGNITQTADNSLTSTAKTMTYGYDDLHRLTTATATNATSTSPGNFTQTYAYDTIGNITNKSDVGNYLYQGTNYANPHAATSVNGVTYAYDNNGNLTSDSTWTHTWNYDNRLTQSTGGSTVTYQYDHTGQRVKLVNGSSTTRYANKLYNSDGTKNVKHIYAGSQLIATLENTTLQYIHTDHLTGSNAATDSNAGMIQLMDYYPYGSMRIDWKFGSFDEQRKFTGHMYDRDTALTYAEARYYKQNIGRFISRDTWEGKLTDPQSLNTYAYSRNNPVKYYDPGGNQFVIPDPITGRPMQPNFTPTQQNFDRLVQSMVPIYGDLQDLSEARSGHDFFTGEQLSGGQKLISKISLFIPLISGRLVRAGGQFLSNIFRRGDDIADVARRTNWGRAGTLADHFERHGGDFGANNVEDYAQRAHAWIESARGNSNVDSFVGRDGYTRFYDTENNILAATNREGATASFFKPDPSVHGQSSNLEYWNSVKERYGGE